MNKKIVRLTVPSMLALGMTFAADQVDAACTTESCSRRASERS